MIFLMTCNSCSDKGSVGPKGMRYTEYAVEAVLRMSLHIMLGSWLEDFLLFLRQRFQGLYQLRAGLSISF